ncbi:MAG TPA: alpha/beta hydrolase [Rhodanobacter sp.]
MSTPREFCCDVRIGRLTGLRSGNPDGPKVLALHGWLDNAASFVPLSRHLDDVDLVMLDLPGHGRSAHFPPGADYMLAGSIAHVLDVADQLQWSRFALLGHSMGGGIASMVAAAVPERITALVTIEALGALAESADHSVSRLRESVAAARALPDKALRVFSGIAAPIRARMRANQLSEPSARLLVERGIRAVEGGYVWCTDPRLTLPTAVRMTEAQIDALIEGIEAPTRVIYADPPQPYFPEPLRSARVARLRHGDMQVIPGCHHLHMEAPAAVAAAIGGLLSQSR